MIDERALRQAFSDFAEAMVGNYHVGDVLYTLTDQCVAVLGVDGAGVSVDSDGRLKFVTATDDRVTRVEEHQVEVGDGPCHQAFRTGEAVSSDDLQRDDRWSHYRPLALDCGYRAVAGIAMPVAAPRVGALNLYRVEPRKWTSEELEVAQLLANVAAGYVINARAVDESRKLSTQLQRALDSRVVIEQAKGIVAQQMDIRVGEAFELLRKRSRQTNTRLHDLCRRIIDGERL